MGCAQNWRTNADCQYGSWCSGGNFSGGNADSRTNAIPKLLLIIAFLLLAGSWMLNTMQDFTRMIFTQMIA